MCEIGVNISMAELTVSRKTILATFTELIKDVKVKKFTIPEYQRPYSWDNEKCEILWDDVLNYHHDQNKGDKYFLGTIVTCKDDSVEGISVIDGQQRITSFFLLLRAFYKKLEDMLVQTPNDKEVEGLMKQIAPCIWDVNPMSQEVSDKTKIHIQSLVASEKDNESFHKIMITGIAEENDKSLYAKNYSFFLNKCDSYAASQPLDWKQLCLCIMNECIVLPIECTDLDSALIIFSTLNDRGMPLSDSDIFKAEIYKTKKSKEEKDTFTQNWKELGETAENAKMSIDDIFKLYTHVLRAKGNCSDSEIGLRKFYSENQRSRLHESNLTETLLEVAHFWEKLISYNDEICTEKTKKYIHCLKAYPNEYWKYPITVLFDYCKRNKKEIKNLLPEYLAKLISYLFVRFIEKPSVNTIKNPVYLFCIDTYKNGCLDTDDFVIVDDFKTKLILTAGSSKIQKAMLLLNSYLFDNSTPLLQEIMEVEHIFPQKWDATYFTWTDEDAKKYIDKIGNKIPFEKKLNIKASNGFFSKKKEEYAKSQNKEVLELTKNQDWTKENIDTRADEMADRLEEFFEENLKSSVITKKLICYTGGTKIVTINYVTSKTYKKYVVIQNDNGKIEQNEFDVFENAVISIDKGLFLYGQEIFVDEECKDFKNCL